MTSTREPVIIANVPLAVKTRLQELADVDEVSVSKLGREALQEYVDKRTVSTT